VFAFGDELHAPGTEREISRMTRAGIRLAACRRARLPKETLVMRSIVVVLSVLTVASPAAAQSTYVGASLLGEFSRFSGVDVNDDTSRITSSPISRNGETIGFDIRIGRALDRRWGVEFEFARGGVNEETRTERLLSSSSSSSRSFPTLPGIGLITPIFPIPDFEFQLELEQQHTTLATTAWVRQELGDQVQVAFSGGVSFNRVETEQSVRITDSRLALSLPVPSEIETVQYGVGPVVGAEVIIDVGDHAALTTGARLHGVSGGWLIRPSVGLRWTF
jgi:hypothetical protein